MTIGPLRIFTGNAHPELAKTICEFIDVNLGNAHVSHFPDGEIDIKVLDDVRGSDAFIVQPTCPPVNENLMELLILIDCLRRASAGRITAIIPYYGYARKDRKDEGRVPITAKLVADLLSTSGAHRVLTMDLHAPQIQGFFDIPTDNLFSAPVFTRDIQKRYNGTNLLFVSPDIGGVGRARDVAKRLDADLAIIDKRRERAGVSEVINVIGDVKGRDCLIVDDIVDSAETLCNAADAVKKAGAERVVAYATHGVLTGNAMARIEASDLGQLVITDSIDMPDEVRNSSRIRTITITPLLAEAMTRVNAETSVSSLFH